MRFWCFGAVVMVSCLLMLTGCVPGLDLDSLLGDLLGGLTPGYAAIPDGAYAGSVQATVEFWEDGEFAGQFEDEGYTDAKFSGGALLKDTGGFFAVGDVDFLDDGVYQITRTVNYVDSGDWGYEIGFDLSAEYDGIPMYGWEIATYWLNDDGTLDLYDEIDLTSDDWYYGGILRTHSDAYSTMSAGSWPVPAPTPAPAPTPSPSPAPLPDWWYKKSG